MPIIKKRNVSTLTFHAALIHTIAPLILSRRERSVKKIPLIAGIFVVVCGQYVFAGGTTSARLDSCIAYYEDGDYQKAADSIKALLPLISDRLQEAEAYKYLGFSYVMLDLINKAKDFFRVALEKFPQMVIDTLEVPPNISIVFKQAKLETQMEKGEILDKKVQESTTKRTALASVLTSTGALCLGGGGYFVFRGYKAWKDYKNVTEDVPDYEEVMNKYWRDKNKFLIIGGSASGAGLAALGCGIWMFVHKPAQKDKKEPPKKVGINADGNGVFLTINF
jgi:tetratricopeptide (TPR) repeat protein